MEVSEILHRSTYLVFLINLSENKINRTERLISLFSKIMLGEIDLCTLQILSLKRLISDCLVWLHLVMSVLVSIVKFGLIWSDLLRSLSTKTLLC